MGLRITLVGLGRVGGSIGLALKKSGAKFELVGHDKNQSVAKSAFKSGCVDRTDWNLLSACDGAELVIISEPLSDLKTTLSAIGHELSAGCVVTDTASLKLPVLGWAHEFLSDQVHFVGGHPIIERTRSETTEPAADLLEGCFYCLTPTTTASPAALERASDLAEAVGAKPYFLEAAEHDGLIAAVEQLPLLSSTALQLLLDSSPAGRELLRLSGTDLTSVTQVLAGDAEDLTQACALNSENLNRWLDSLVTGLTALQRQLADGDIESLQKAFERAVEAQQRWSLKQTEEGSNVDYSEFSMSRKMLGDMFRPRKPKGE